MYINVNTHTHAYIDILMSSHRRLPRLLWRQRKVKLSIKNVKRGGKCKKPKTKTVTSVKIIAHIDTHTHTHSHWIFHNIRNNSHYARPAFLLQLKKKLITKILIASAVNIVRNSQVTPQTLGNLLQQPTARPFFIVIWKYK